MRDKKKPEHQRIDAFELWCWRKLLRVPWTAGKSNQSILKEISPECSLETLILWPPDAKSWLIWKDLDVAKDCRWEEKGTIEDDINHWMASPTQWRWVSVNSGSWWWTGGPGVLQSMVLRTVRHDWVTELNCKHIKCHWIYWKILSMCASGVFYHSNHLDRWREKERHFTFPGSIFEEVFYKPTEF